MFKNSPVVICLCFLQKIFASKCSQILTIAIIHFILKHNIYTLHLFANNILYLNSRHVILQDICQNR